LITNAVFVGCKKSEIQPMMRLWRSSRELAQEPQMHDVLIALAFIGMVIAPAIVAAKSGSSESKFD
jgi:hypothetical protein